MKGIWIVWIWNECVWVWEREKEEIWFRENKKKKRIQFVFISLFLSLLLWDDVLWRMNGPFSVGIPSPSPSISPLHRLSLLSLYVC